MQFLTKMDAAKDEASLREAMKWVSLSTELPIMVGLFAYLGYLVGKRYGAQYDILGLLAGGLIGFVLGLFGLFAATGIMGPRRQRERPSGSREK
jgi:F0F1-type ATP synthase assembly protein I